MLSIEEIKLLKEKLLKLKGTDWEKFLGEQIQILTDIENAVDANNKEIIDRLDKTPEWFQLDNQKKKEKPMVDEALRRQVQTKIFQFSRTNLYNSLEIGPGNGMFSMDFRAWHKQMFLDILPQVEKPIRKMFPNQHQKHLVFYRTKNTECSNIPQNSCNFVFSWDTFPFFTQNHTQQYLHDIKRVLIDGGYCMIQYADCHYDIDLQNAKRGYWNYNTKTEMTRMIEEEGYKVIEMNQFRPGANFAIFQKPGKQNPVVYKKLEITLD
tara:strand:+ start:24 stop:821 length:798 start_codon:yes stop_codon:yes gene_type:complete